MNSLSKTEDLGGYPRGFGPSGLREELTGFETANRTQQGNQGGQGSGFQGNGNNRPQTGPQDDPWAVSATSNAAGGGATDLTPNPRSKQYNCRGQPVRWPRQASGTPPANPHPEQRTHHDDARR